MLDDFACSTVAEFLDYEHTFCVLDRTTKEIKFTDNGDVVLSAYTLNTRFSIISCSDGECIEIESNGVISGSFHPPVLVGILAIVNTTLGKACGAEANCGILVGRLQAECIKIVGIGDEAELVAAVATIEQVAVGVGVGS